MFAIAALAAAATPPKAAIGVTVADAPAILAAVKAPGARAVLLNVWATWCEPCREEMPEFARLYREHRAAGLRLVTVAADDEDQRAAVARVLADLGLDGPAFIKRGDDNTFINALEPRWSGALPVTILYDGRGEKKQFWPGAVTYDALKKPVTQLLKTRRRP
jgi:thiol-disulfide isomerase/thioredoxin